MKPFEIVIRGDRQSGKTTVAMNLLRAAAAGGLQVAYFAPTQEVAAYTRKKYGNDFPIRATTVSGDLFSLAPPQVAVFDDAHKIQVLATGEGHPIDIIRTRMSVWPWAQIILVLPN